MEQFDALLRVAEKLLSPEGCPWDQKQTFLTLQPYVLEEAHEVIEAVDLNDNQKMIEELGDLLYTIVFYAKLGEKHKRFSMEEIVTAIKEKLIRRHPHIFADLKVENMEEIISNWEKIKKEEKKQKPDQSALDGIPPSLPALIRGQKVVKKVLKSDFDFPKEHEKISEEELGGKLLALLAQAERSDVDAESALRRALKGLEDSYRNWELSY